MTVELNNPHRDSIEAVQSATDTTLFPNAHDLEKDAAISNPSKSKEGQDIREPEPVYSVFSTGEKRFITAIAALTTALPPLTASIAINLTITAYLIFQGLAPSFIGNLSDETGRRPALIVCFVIHIAACLGAAIKGDYVQLMIMRCLQSAGSSGTIALSYATVSDIVTSAERGKYMAFAQMGNIVGPALGPVAGGLLSQYFGWRSIFWFLAVVTLIVLVICLGFLPETCRKIVGNGSIPPQKWNRPLVAHFRSQKQCTAVGSAETKTRMDIKIQLNPLSSLKVFFDKELSILLLYGGLIYAGSYFVLSGMPAQLQDNYGFNTVQISLCYLSTGLGSLAAILFVGYILDWNFRRHAKRLGIEISKHRQQDLDNFPVELARLQVSLPLLFLAAASLVAYGWVIHAKSPLAAPLIFLFLTSFGYSSSFSGFTNLIVDLNREKAGTAAAAMNLARCWIGAGGVALANPLINAVGSGWASVIVAAIWLILSPVVFWTICCGPRWREEKRLKRQAMH